MIHLLLGYERGYSIQPAFNGIWSFSAKSLGPNRVRLSVGWRNFKWENEQEIMSFDDTSLPSINPGVVTLMVDEPNARVGFDDLKVYDLSSVRPMPGGRRPSRFPLDGAKLTLQGLGTDKQTYAGSIAVAGGAGHYILSYDVPNPRNPRDVSTVACDFTVGSLAGTLIRARADNCYLNGGLTSWAFDYELQRLRDERMTLEGSARSNVNANMYKVTIFGVSQIRQ